MTFRRIVLTMLRRWYILFAILACGVAYASHLASTGGVFSTRTVVFFIDTPVNRVDLGPNNGTEDESIIAFAGAVAAEINNGRAVVRYARDEAPLYGAGMRDGVVVGLADVGGQWTASFSRAEIVIQVVAPSYDAVQERQQDLIQKVNETSERLQGDSYNDAATRIRAEVLPLTDSIYHVAASRTERIAAYSIVLIAALILGSWLAIRVDLRFSSSTRTPRSIANRKRRP